MSTAGKIFVISAPSGTGKTTIAKELKKSLKDMEVITTYTTRKPRPEEKNGDDYRFITPMQFERMIENGDFAEWAVVYGNYYGTPKRDVISAINQRKKVLLIIDTQGGRSIKRIFPEAVLIGVLPPSTKEQERRMRKRSDLSDAEIKKRLEATKEERRIILSEYDHCLINKNLDNTVKRIKQIINKEERRING